MGISEIFTADWWKTNWKLVVTAVIVILFPYIGGSIGGGIVASGEIDTWYAQVNRPTWQPPNWLFGPAWAVLYFCMGLASFLVWKDGRKQSKAEIEQTCYFGWSEYTTISKVAMGLYLVSIALNWAWTPVFFGLHRVLDSFAIIVVLDVVVFCSIFVFFKINKAAGLLMVPYLCWISFATALNVAIWQLNCDVDGVFLTISECAAL